MVLTTEMLAVLLGGLLIVLGLFRYMVSYTQNADMRRLEFFKRYEDARMENINLKAAVAAGQLRERAANEETVNQKRQTAKYRNLYREALDRLAKRE